MSLTAAFVPAVAHAQFTLQHSGTTASLRGVSNVNGKVAWASGTGGTVLRTRDGGRTWEPCATPAGAEQLDFRAVQAFDTEHALVMSSGKGDLSRIYRTVDGCKTWKLIYTNPDAPDGFFDALMFQKPDDGWVLGDPVRGSFFLANTQNEGVTWQRSTTPDLKVPAGKSFGAFAASNQSLTLSLRGPIFGGGLGWIYDGTWPSCSLSVGYNEPEQCLDHMQIRHKQLELGSGNDSSGVFALFATNDAIVAVGGDYSAPEIAAHTAAYSWNNGSTWQAAEAMPHGYRSSIAWDADSATFVTVGPNGTDVSTDNGNHWKPLKPSKDDAADADHDWNALSLPYVVGPKGRIGRLRDDALPKAP